MANVLGKGEKIFQVIIHICLVLLAACAIIPVWVLVSGSITGEQELILKGYSFFPKSLSADAYKYLFYKASEILRAYGTPCRDCPRKIPAMLPVRGSQILTVMAAPAMSSRYSIRIFLDK